jgi:hypothetical protein
MFPSQLDSIGYWAYDIQDPSQGTSHPHNLNAESWATIYGDLTDRLHMGQTTFRVLKTCAPTSRTSPPPPRRNGEPVEQSPKDA